MKNIQFKRTTAPLRIVGSLLCALLVSFAALAARAQTAAVIAPQGDAFYSNGHEAPAFLDIIAASITISNTLTLTVDVAGSLAGLPNPPGFHGVFDWHFALNTDDSTDPPGLPLPPKITAPADFYVGALWDGSTFSGLLIDRRPALIGQPALSYSIPVSVSGSRIIITVPAALAAEIRAAVVLPGATWNCITLRADVAADVAADDPKGAHGLHGADAIGRQPWPQ
ncbi:MAG TPA: hypothetical protein VK639_14105 [Terriglobales bacterium]|nr:hypothetical protein [Terriglobales bacterium]